MARTGHERFTQPTVATHRRYEALRAYYVEELSAAEIAARFGYTKASVQTLISQYRKADPGELFQTSRPGPKRQPKKDAARERAIGEYSYDGLVARLSPIAGGDFSVAVPFPR